MKFYDQKYVKIARKLRGSGISAAKIAEKLGTSEGTVLRWCYDIPLSSAFHIHQQKIYTERSELGKSIARNFKLSKTSAKILCALLYLCEGSRYPTSNTITFTNSDIELVKLFLKFFRVGFNPESKKFRAHLQLHTTHDAQEIHNFWSKILKIPKSQFYKPTITAPTKRMKRTDYRGTCDVRYHDFKMFHELMGIAKGLMSNINEG